MVGMAGKYGFDANGETIHGETPGHSTDVMGIVSAKEHTGCSCRGENDDCQLLPTVKDAVGLLGSRRRRRGPRFFGLFPSRHDLLYREETGEHSSGRGTRRPVIIIPNLLPATGEIAMQPCER